MRHFDDDSHRHRGPRGRHDSHERHKHSGGPQTFRRGRALAFLETLNVRRATLRQQLEQSELQSVHPVIAGELKAIEMVRDEFMAMFDLRESPEQGVDRNEPPHPQQNRPLDEERTSATASHAEDDV
ncbi:hypothetical protein [Alicyclobacillus hesperidum]|uniref:hypothetical protein n=1 Tax=Alicyclobacillus hesperidum TaxID=89784 RepID=UPI00030EDB83|nr:hypothetical protein [Alicyclobacillus hesperidum]